MSMMSETNPSSSCTAASPSTSTINRGNISNAQGNGGLELNQVSDEQRGFKQESHDDRHGQQRSLPTSMQEPVNFGSDRNSMDPLTDSYSRRVTIGSGIHSGLQGLQGSSIQSTMDKTSALNSFSNNMSNVQNNSMLNNAAMDSNFRAQDHHSMGSMGSMGGFNGGFGNSGVGMMDRRGSMASLGMDDFFSNFGGGFPSRRGSLACLDTLGGVDNLFGPAGFRRDSIDSTSATLDAAFMDLHRRRYSLGLPPFQDNSNHPLGGAGNGGVMNAFGGLQSNVSVGSNLGVGLHSNSGVGLHASANNGGMHDPLTNNVINRDVTPHDSIATRQAQLQAQQRELERKQKQLELDRQRLLENIRQRNFGMGTNLNDRSRLAMMEMEAINNFGRPLNFPLGNGDGIPGLGRGPTSMGASTSTHNHLANVALDHSARSHNLQQSYFNPQGMNMDNSVNSNNGVRASRNWHICQFCNSKAFASLDEALAHESICLDNPMRNGFLNNGQGINGGQGVGMNSSFFNNPLNAGQLNAGQLNPGQLNPGQLNASNLFERRAQQGGLNDNLMHPPQSHPRDNVNRNFSIGMDSSQRSTMSFGMGGNFHGVDAPVGHGLNLNNANTARGGMDGSQRSTLSLSNGQDHSRRSEPSLDGSTHSFNQSALSEGPFAMLHQPIPLAMDSDKDWLTPLHCFVRRHCVEVFTATDDDVATPSKGKRKPIHVGQIGIRCPHCQRQGNDNSKSHERGSVYYPTSIKSIYNATMNLLQRHLHSCPVVPEEIMRRYETLKADDARSGTSKRYWEESASSLGLVDTINGIRYSALNPPPLPTLTLQQETNGKGQVRRNSNEFFSTKSNALTESGICSDSGMHSDYGLLKQEENDFDKNQSSTWLPTNDRFMPDTSSLVTEDDKPYATLFSFHLLGQMQSCLFTEADRLGKRKGLPPGFPGLACRHCFGGYGSGRFFPSSIKTLSDTSKTLNVLHNHMMRCRKCPTEVREILDKLRGSHDEERAKMKFGSQKAFFARIWERLHGKGFPGFLKRPASRSASTGSFDNDDEIESPVRKKQVKNEKSAYFDETSKSQSISPKPPTQKSQVRQQNSPKPRQKSPVPKSVQLVSPQHQPVGHKLSPKPLHSMSANVESDSRSAQQVSPQPLPKPVTRNLSPSSMYLANKDDDCDSMSDHDDSPELKAQPGMNNFPSKPLNLMGGNEGLDALAAASSPSKRPTTC